MNKFWILILFVFRYLLILVSSECFSSNYEECRNFNKNNTGSCVCPCLPKCCPKNHILSHGPIHGFQCIYQPDGPDLPDVDIVNNKTESNAARYYESGFPTCLGINGTWKFDLYFKQFFRLNTTYEDEYVLTVSMNSSTTLDEEIKIVSNNQGENLNESENQIVNIIKFKPLLYFCFDQISKDGEQETVAMTCPKIHVAPEIKIYKCCPEGETLEDATLKGCKPRDSNIHRPLSLPINGHLFTEEELRHKGQLIYDEKKSFLVDSTRQECDERAGFEVSHEQDTFHIGADGQIHFLDSVFQHIGYGAFCVDDLDTASGEGEDVVYNDEVHEHYDEGIETVSSNDNSYEECHDDHKQHNIVAFFCSQKVYQIPKCCGQDENLNLRGRSCTSHRAKNWTNLTIYTESGELLEPSEVVLNPLGHHIYGMNQEFLYVSNENFRYFINETLDYGGKNYNRDNFCLDYSINYCSGAPTLELRAIINDPTLAEDKDSTIFGNNMEDSYESKMMKRIGYPISILALLITIAVFFLVEDLKNDLHAKMVVCIVTCLLIVFICLFIKTFESAPSRTNIGCIIGASLTYFFILCTFAWMSAMSYNIMTKFRGTSILPKTLEVRRFHVYSCYCFGIPALMVIIVVSIDRLLEDETGEWLSLSSGGFWRPGFGEESCWFNSCSKALTIFLYGPIALVLMANLMLFVYSALRLSLMQQKLQKREEQRLNSSLTLKRSDSLFSESSARSSFKELKSQLSTITNVSSRLKRLANHRDKLTTYLKLFVAMGLTWVFEVLTWFLTSNNNPPPKELLLTVNFLNICQGLIVFLVFAVKKNNKEKLRIAFIRRGITFSPRATKEDLCESRIRRVTSRETTNSLPSEFRKLRMRSLQRQQSNTSTSSGPCNVSTLSGNEMVISHPGGFPILAQNVDPPSPT